MELINLEIRRIIIHQVYRRDEQGNVRTPLQSHEYTRFDTSAMLAFKNRVADALGDRSKAVQMKVHDQSPTSTPALVDTVINQNDAEFAVSSYDFATKLAAAQHSKNIPGGILVVFTGTYGVNNSNFLAFIKAEVHSGYEIDTDDETGEISLKFVEELLLTPGTKLYKTGAFFEKPHVVGASGDLNEKWTPYVSDNQINKVDGKAAAQYFFADFLGCAYPETSARTTKSFLDESTRFISNLDAPEEQRSNYLNALKSYLKVEGSSIVNPNEFADRIFDTDTRDSYIGHLTSNGIPATAFTKDLEHISNSLKLTRIRFSQDIKISIPSDKFNDLMEIETFEGEPDENGLSKEWTKITIKDRIIGQE
jgi:nucleoid-associated protein YejK